MKNQIAVNKMFCWMVWNWEDDVPFYESEGRVKLIFNKDEAAEYGAKEVEIIYRSK